jgi:hypothetical protein
MGKLERAISIAVEAHAGQVDKAGEPYILHPLRVVENAMENDMISRDQLERALAKPVAVDGYDIYPDCFNPWDDVIHGIYGDYASKSDDLMIEALKAARDRTTFDFIDRDGFSAEFALYVLAGHGMTDYGTSPRGGWPKYTIADLWQPLIDKWEAYRVARWGPMDGLGADD